MVARKQHTEAVPVSEPLTYLRAIRDARDLYPSEKLVANAIALHAGSDCQHSHPGNELLARETGLHVQTVKEATRSLRRKNYLILTYSGRGGRHDRANEYRLAVPKAPSVHLETGISKKSQTTLEDNWNIPKVACDGSQSSLERSQSSLRHPTDAPSTSALNRNALLRTSEKGIYLEDEDEETFYVGTSKKHPSGYFISQANADTRPKGSVEVKLNAAQRRLLFDMKQHRDRVYRMLQWAGIVSDTGDLPSSLPSSVESEQAARDYKSSLANMTDEQASGWANAMPRRQPL